MIGFNRFLFITLFVWFQLAQVQSKCDYKYTRDGYHNFMGTVRGLSSKSLNKFLLLGSHDAGARRIFDRRVGPVGSTVLAAQDQNAITQTLDIHDQLCASYRVFDLRFKQPAQDLPYYIWHGSFGMNYYFNADEIVAGEINRFCMDAEHAGEVILLRLKIIPANGSRKVDFLRYFLSLIGKCVPILPQGLSAYDFFNSRPISEITSLPRFIETETRAPTAAVIVMIYDEEFTSDFLRTTPASTTLPGNLDSVVMRYTDVMSGKSSEKSKVKHVVPLQLRKYEQYRAARRDGLVSTPFFGFWMCLTVALQDVLGKTKKKLSDKGRYHHWLSVLIKDGKFPNVGGLTIWTDAAGTVWEDAPSTIFRGAAGDSSMLSVRRTALQVNTNIAAAEPGERLNAMALLRGLDVDTYIAINVFLPYRLDSRTGEAYEEDD